MNSPSYIILISAFLIALAVSILIIPQIIYLTKKFNLLDKPNQRSSHKSPTPTLGGIGIFAGLIISTAVSLKIFGLEIPSIMYVATSLLFISGLWDDIRGLGSSKKFLIQITAAMLIASSGIRIEGLFGLFGIEHLPIVLQYAFTVVIIVAITNAYNLFDGIDGLAGGIGFMNASVFGILFYFANEPGWALMSFAIAGALLGFLRYNFSPAKIFMGDTGSLVIGFLFATCSIFLLQNHPVIDSPIGEFSIFLIVPGILLLTVYDMTRLFTERILSGKSPFKADKNHIHHLLLKTGFNHYKASWILYSANVILILGAFLLHGMNNMNLAILFLVLASILLTEILTITRVLKSVIEVVNIKKSSQKMIQENLLLYHTLKN